MKPLATLAIIATSLSCTGCLGFLLGAAVVSEAEHRQPIVIVQPAPLPGIRCMLGYRLIVLPDGSPWCQLEPVERP
jgi:hypothetical protein